MSCLAFCSRQGQLLRSDQVAQVFIQSHLAKPSEGDNCRTFQVNPCLSGLNIKTGFLLFSYHLPCLILFLAHHCEEPGHVFIMVSCPALENCYYVPSKPATRLNKPTSFCSSSRTRCSPSLNHFHGCPLNSESQNILSPTCK